MLNHPTLDKLKELKFTGMARGLEEQLNSPSYEPLSFEERLGLLIDREATERENRRLKTRLALAKLRLKACVEEIDFTPHRDLDRSLILSLSNCGWIREAFNVIITGPTGVGKSFIACALAHKACLEGFKVRYFRMSRLFQELRTATGDGTYPKLLSKIAKNQLIVLDDWGLKALNEAERNDLMEILEDRHGHHSTLIASQLPVDLWHDYIGNPTLADAILDRIIHNGYRISMKGDSMRKRKAMKT